MKNCMYLDDSQGKCSLHSICLKIFLECFKTQVRFAPTGRSFFVPKITLFSLLSLGLGIKRKRKLDYIYLSGWSRSHEAPCIKLLEKTFYVMLLVGSWNKVSKQRVSADVCGCFNLWKSKKVLGWQTLGPFLWFLY